MLVSIAWRSSPSPKWREADIADALIAGIAFAQHGLAGKVSFLRDSFAGRVFGAVSGFDTVCLELFDEELHERISASSSCTAGFLQHGSVAL
jgi:hypothetical protein